MEQYRESEEQSPAYDISGLMDNIPSYGKSDDGANSGAILFVASADEDPFMGNRRTTSTGGGGSTRLFITKLPFEITAEDLRDYFEQFGPVSDSYVPRNPYKPYMNKGFGFVSFAKSHVVDNVLAQTVHMLRHRAVVVDRAAERRRYDTGRDLGDADYDDYDEENNINTSNCTAAFSSSAPPTTIRTTLQRQHNCYPDFCVEADKKRALLPNSTQDFVGNVFRHSGGVGDLLRSSPELVQSLKHSFNCLIPPIDGSYVNMNTAAGTSAGANNNNTTSPWGDKFNTDMVPSGHPFSSMTPLQNTWPCGNVRSVKNVTSALISIATAQPNHHHLRHPPPPPPRCGATTATRTMPNRAKLFVGRLSFLTSSDCLRRYFSKYGEIEDAYIPKEPTTGRSRGFGFVTFSDSSAIDRVLMQAPHEIDNRHVALDRADPAVRNYAEPTGGRSSTTNNRDNNICGK